MATPVIPLSVQHQIVRIREWSREGHHADALRAAEALATGEPHNRDALYLVAANQRSLNRIHDALETLHRLEQHHPRYSLLHQERGHCYVALRDAPRAIEAFAQAVSLNPALVPSWTVLELLFRMAGETVRADAAAQQLAALQHLPAAIVRAGSLFSDGDLDPAESILRSYLHDIGNHVEALRLLAKIVHQRGALDEAERFLADAVQLAPDHRAAQLDYARVLVEVQKYVQAKESAGFLLRLEPDNRDFLALFAAACAGLGNHEQAIQLYSDLLAAGPHSWDLLMPLGHSLQSVGRTDQAIDSYRAAASAKPGLGDAWWSLANLKSYRFSAEEIARMQSEESAPGAPPVDRTHLCFALGKAFEDRNQFTESWRFYERGNALMRAGIPYDPSVIETSARKLIEVCTAPFFAARAGCGAPSPDPIFIVGLPRSGSTLIEQILASHSQVEGTQELPEIPRIAREQESPEALANLPPDDLRRLGERYLAETRAWRGSKPFFIDKMPNNFRHIGLIHLILPNATIIDVRRDPMSCCFSNLKQLFAGGQEFTYSIPDIARYYRTYLDLMRHWDQALPGRVLHVFYEDLVGDLESSVRRVLEYCNLEFEANCLEFYKTERSIRTPSSEQVRRPIFRDGLDQWRNYEPWLGPLNDALQDAVIRYRE